ncbi:MAG: hypothetical protein ACREBH_02910 [Candidatus Micrarchaeaceae archaeon]
MDHSNVDVKVEQDRDLKAADESSYVTENGKNYRIPYKMIKIVTFTDMKKEELIDIPHAARLQYRLMLLDPVIKARVDFTKAKISVIFNPREADNIREKMSLEELKEFLTKQGVNVDNGKMVLDDYDYYKELYSYAYNPPEIRERAPYGYTMEQWKNMRPEWEEKMRLGEIEKQSKYRDFQDSYLESDPNAARVVDPNFKPKVNESKGMIAKLFGKNKKGMQKEKGFWFHGV